MPRSNTNSTLRIETDPLNLLVFIYEQDYPVIWTSEDFNDGSTLIIRIERAGELVGYLWSVWLDGETAQFHGCSKSRLWLSPEVFHDLLVIARFYHIKTLTCEPVGPNATTIAALLTRLGFQRDGDDLILKLE